MNILNLQFAVLSKIIYNIWFKIELKTQYIG